MNFDIDCTPEEGSVGNNYKLKLNFDLDEGKLRELFKSEMVSIGSDIEFKAVSGWDEINEFTTGGKTVQMTIKNQKDSFHLRVELATLEESGGIGLGRGGITVMTQRTTRQFICSTSGLVGTRGASGEGTIFTGIVSSSGNKRLVSADEQKVNGQLSLKGCTEGSDEKSITCDLKL